MKVFRTFIKDLLKILYVPKLNLTKIVKPEILRLCFNLKIKINRKKSRQRLLVYSLKRLKFTTESFDRGTKQNILRGGESKIN